MRFGVAHKTATYLMVGAAFVGMTLGGGVSPLFALAGAVGLVVSWWWEAPRVRLERWTTYWTVASIAVLAYAAVDGVASGDYLGAGAEFLIWLTVAKAFNRRAPRDWQQLYLLALLMLVAGSVLDADSTYGVSFLVFVIASTWALTLFHLRRETEDNLLVRHDAGGGVPVEVQRILASRRIVDARFFVGTGLVSFVIFLASAAAFLAIPRIGAGFFMKARNSLSMTGFSDGVHLGGHGTIKTDTTIVMRVKVPPEYRGRDSASIHWRGVAFDRYHNGEWSRSRAAPSSTYLDDVPTPGHERRALVTPGSHVRARELDALQASAVRQEVWLEPMDSDVMFGGSMPDVFQFDAEPHPGGARGERNDEVRYQHTGTIHYTVWSTLTRPDAATLRGSSGPLPPGYDVFTQLPPEITARTRALARTITAGLTNDYDRATAIVTWLGNNLKYSLDLKDPGKQEPIDFFLFDRKSGHCEYFASAFAILARSVGIPTRNVDGFLGGEWNEYDDYIAVREGDAHSWAEVFFPHVGWVTFDPTPAGEDVLGHGGTGALDRLHRFLDTLRFQWTRWVIDYDLSRQLGLFSSVGSAIKTAATAIRNGLTAAGRTAWRNWPLTAALVALIGLFVMGRVKRRRRDLAASGGRRDSRRRGRVVGAYQRARRGLARRGDGLDPALTPRELARAHADRVELTELTDLYYAVEYGDADDRAHATRAEALVTALEEAWTTADHARKRLPA